jgi:hypothetical protein
VDLVGNLVHSATFARNRDGLLPNKRMINFAAKYHHRPNALAIDSCDLSVVQQFVNRLSNRKCRSTIVGHWTPSGQRNLNGKIRDLKLE